MIRPPLAILIVDHDCRNRQQLEASLRPDGYVTRTATTGVEALASIRDDPPDLILLDVMVPGMDAPQVVALVRADPAIRTIPIIMVTARDDHDARLALLDSGVDELLTRPVDRAELLLRIRNLLRLRELSDFHAHHRSLLEDEVQARTADLQRFRTAMDSTGDAILLVDRRAMRFVEVNATACRMTGYSRDELLRLGPVDLQPGPASSERSRIIDAPMAEPSEPSEPTESVGSIGTVQRKDGTSLAVEIHRHAQLVVGEWLIVTVLRDITERTEAEHRLQRLAHYDALTGLPNRALFHETLRQTVHHASTRGWTVAVLFLDIDHFKNVNDILGHGSGDELLVEVGHRLVGCVRIRDTVGRLGGDEFALILEMDDGPQGAAAVATKIHEAMREPFELSGHELAVTASIGITTFPDDALAPETLLKYADTAMYQAKHAGRDTFRYFTPSMNSDALARLDLEIALRRAVKNGEFVLHYQPKAYLERGTVAGVEALLRWQRPGHGLVPPGAFIPALEETGLIVDVGRWVIDEACRQVVSWMRSGVGQVQVAVNVAGRQFLEGDLEADVVRALESHSVPGHLLELELTESSLMENTERTIAILGSLKAHGVQISIDDFGTGYSSLAYLRRFPIDKLKIDIAFIREITTNPDDAAIALAIIHMAHSLNLDVVAEGVETAGQLEYLRRNHCDQMQGYFLSRPLPVAELEELLLAGTSLPVPDAVRASSTSTLLIVDDDTQVLGILQMLLDGDGYRVLTAASAAEGFELLALHEVHVVMCDVRMPRMSGTEFLHRVRELHPDALRIVLSGCADGDDLVGMSDDAEVYRHHTKPWDAGELRESLQEAFRHYWRLHDARPISSAGRNGRSGPPGSRRASAEV